MSGTDACSFCTSSLVILHARRNQSTDSLVVYELMEDVKLRGAYVRVCRTASLVSASLYT